MTDQPDRTVEGWAQFAGQPLWSSARFEITGDATDPVLLIDPEAHDAVRVDLTLVTALDEMLGGATGHQHLELVVEGRVFAEVVWPPEFTDEVVRSLESTVDDPEPVADVRRPRSRASAGLIGTLGLVGCGALIVGAMGLREPEPEADIDIEVRTVTTIRGTTTVAPDRTTTTAPAASSTTTIVSTPAGTDGCEATATPADEDCSTGR